jgi:3-hydroxyisobutyrate dehydrogenase
VQVGDAIGFVGLGNMGQPMSARLGAAGFRVAAFDVDARARETAARNPGVDAVSSVSAVAAGAGAVVLILPDSRAVRQVVLEAGLLETMQSGAVLIDMSSAAISLRGAEWPEPVTDEEYRGRGDDGTV